MVFNTTAFCVSYLFVIVALILTLVTGHAIKNAPVIEDEDND
jgi:hypothetical protein